MSDTSAVVRLDDGRELGYTSIGDPDGDPILFFHGAPGSRLLPQHAEAPLVRAGVRMIGVDRPGFGLSHYQPGRRLTDWPQDVLGLANGLGIERFSLFAVSSGGPYALACCAAFPERVTGAFIFSCLTPSRRPALVSDASSMPGPLILALRRSQLISRAVYRLLVATMRRDPARAVAGLAKGLSESDARVLGRPELRDFICRTTLEAARHGTRGWVTDDHLLCQPWGFSLSDVPAALPLDLWHGSDDPAIPADDARALAAALPGASLRVLEGEGHMFMFDRLDEAIATLAGRGPAGLRRERPRRASGRTELPQDAG